jgi:uncharacterized lipoprotein YmbA
MLMLAACSLPLPAAVSDATRVYVLTSAPAGTELPAAGAAARRVYVRPVAVPEFLRGRIMPVQVAGNEVKFVDTARWAEPLEPGLTRVLRENLGRGAQVVGRAAEPHEFDVAVQLRHCEGVLPAGVARIAAHVEIISADASARLVAQDDFETDVPAWDGEDYGQLTAKLSEAAAALSERIAALLPSAKP